jgi:hypothetical protein
MKIVSLVFLIATAFSAQSQDMLKALKREHNMMRFGIGIQASDPLALNLQLFKGFFCSNDDTYATKMVWELTGGLENVLFKSMKDYSTGKWTNGGFQAALSGYYPVANILARGFTIQFYPGLGLQAGNRKYRENGVNGILSENSFGVNLSAQASLMGRGIAFGNGVWFVTLYGGIKYHKQFSDGFNYVKPTLGLVMRKAR